MFEQQAELRPSYCPSTTLYNWKSQASGIEVVLIKCPTPAVNGYFAVATEIADDSGSPHTLEHLVFMGSQKYPYKGFLDVLGNKQLSSTNAWTGKDQTVYTLSTAGDEGFLAMLPVYLDHVLHPKITESTCLTEVYHIDGEGQERGVVFSEMQGVENTPFALIAGELHQQMYGAGHPYASNTGGLLRELRTITPRQIADFHASAYSPRNLSVIVTGDVDPEALIAVMSEFERGLLEVPPPPMERPFERVDPAPEGEPPGGTRVKTIEFPESSETYGEIQMGWFGTAIDDLLSYDALEVLNYYFTLENNGKMQQALVEVADPLCNAVYVETDDYKRTLITVSLNCVPTERLDEGDAAVMDLLRRCARDVDLEFLRDCTRRKRNKFVANVENDPASFAYMAIDNFLYGDKPKAGLLRELTDKMRVYDELLAWTAAQWSAFIARIFLDQPHTTVIGRPSKALSRAQKHDKRARTREIRSTMDLDALGKRVQRAKEENEIPVPQALLDEFAVPDLDKIKFIQTESAGVTGDAAGGESKLHARLAPEVAALGLNLQFESYASKFVSIKIYMNSHLVDADLLPYVDVLLCEAFNLPMLVGGTLMTAEQVGLETSRDLLTSNISTNAMLQELVMFDVRALSENYHKAIEWIERAIFDVVYDPERVEMLIKKYLTSVTEEAREGNSVMTASIHQHSLTERSLRRQSETLLVTEFFKAKTDMAQVGRDMKRLSEQLYRAHNMRVLVFGDVYGLRDPVQAWAPLVKRLVGTGPCSGLTPVPFSKQHRSELGRTPARKAFVTLCPTDSSFASIVAKAPTSYVHEDVPALTLLNVYLGVTEGPLWREIRGEGLAYGARIFHRPELGYVICEFYNASDVIQAYKTTKRLLHELATSADNFSDSDIQGAVLGFASALALDQATQSSAVIQKYFDTMLKGLGDDYVRRLIGDVRRVTKQQLLAALHKYLLPLFEVDTSAVFSVCSRAEAAPLEGFFGGVGFEVETGVLFEGDSEDEEDSEGSEESEEEESEEDSEEDSDSQDTDVSSASPVPPPQ